MMLSIFDIKNNKLIEDSKQRVNYTFKQLLNFIRNSRKAYQRYTKDRDFNCFYFTNNNNTEGIYIEY